MRGNFFYKRLGNKILLERKRRKLSQEKLAFLSAVDRTYLARIEEGKANPTVKVLGKLSRALQLRVYQLVEEV